MDKLAAALERANRDGATRDGAPSGHARTRPPGEVRRVALPSIEYTHTRKVRIPAAALERFRSGAIERSAGGEAFRMLRTQVLLRMRENGWRTLAVTSPHAGAGSTTVAFNLAARLALEVDTTALLVDANLRAPQLRAALDLPHGPGLADHLVAGVSLGDILIHPLIGRLVLLPGGSGQSDSSEWIRSPMMARTVDELTRRYADRVIVFDTPPVLSSADTLALAPLVDAFLMVVEEGRTTAPDLQRACDLLENTTLLGIVHNKSREPGPDDRPRRRFGWLRRRRRA